MCTENPSRYFFEMTELFRGADPSVLTPELTKNEQVLLLILCNLYQKENKGVRVSSLVEHTDWTAPAVSRTLKSLEQKGFISRQTDPENRRNTYVHMTDSGLKMSEHISSIMKNFMENVIAEVGEEDFLFFKNTVKHIINIIKKHIEEERGTEKS